MLRIAFLTFLLASCSPKNNSNEPASTDDAATPKTQAAEPPDSETKPAGQSFQDGMQLICDALEHVDAGLTPSERQQAVATWIGENVTNPQVRELFSIIGDVPPSKRSGMMKAAAAKAGITKCPIADQ